MYLISCLLKKKILKASNFRFNLLVEMHVCEAIQLIVSEWYLDSVSGTVRSYEMLAGRPLTIM